MPGEKLEKKTHKKARIALMMEYRINNMHMYVVLEMAKVHFSHSNGSRGKNPLIVENLFTFLAVPVPKMASNFLEDSLRHGLTQV